MKHADISAALDALAAQLGIAQLHRPNYAGGRVNVQLTTTDRPVIGLSLDDALFTLTDRDTLADKLEEHFENAANLLCGAQIVSACTSGREPKFQLDAMPLELRREVCDTLARVFLELAAGDELKAEREWLHRRLGLFAVPAEVAEITSDIASITVTVTQVCPKCGKPIEGGSDRRDGSDLCWCPTEEA